MHKFKDTMKEKTRSGLFETNSSSVHTLVMRRSDTNRKFDKDVNYSNGILRIPCGDFSNDGVVHGQADKLSYIASYITLASGYGPWGECCDFNTLDSWHLNDFFDTLRSIVPDLEDIIVTDTEKACFDHQTAPGSSDCIVDWNSRIELSEFLFNDDIYIEMGRD